MRCHRNSGRRPVLLLGAVLAALAGATPVQGQATPDPDGTSPPQSEQVQADTISNEMDPFVCLLRGCDREPVPEFGLSAEDDAALKLLNSLTIADWDALPVPPPPPPSGAIRLVSGSPAVAARLGTKPLAPQRRVCLAEGEEAVLASNRATFQLEGAQCFTLGKAESDAYQQEEAALGDSLFDAAVSAYHAALQGGDPAAIAAAAEELKVIARRYPEELQQLRRFAFALGAMVRGLWTPELAAPKPPSKQPRPVIIRISSGSASALARFPRGSVVERSASLCLKAGEQLTVATSTGQAATYTGPGCLTRRGQATADNIGAFVFG